ncbi:Hsp70 family protein, partial [Nocardia sp. NPDC058497]|uniref:Hsp70 family protein n=1 Tax=Nocardia sp. NPDC058497 TaxID=3346529 RepID=UPI003661A97A
MRTATAPDDAVRMTGFGDLTMAGNFPFAADLPAAELIARALREVMSAAGAAAEHTVLAHPAVYRRHQLRSLRRALDGVGLGQVELVAEPLAAAASLDRATDQRPGESSTAAADSVATVVYDLGATTLDIAVVVRDAAGHRIAGRPVRSLSLIQKISCPRKK